MARLRGFLTRKAGRKKKKNVDLDRSSSTQLGSNTFSVATGESTRTHCQDLETLFKKFDVNGDGRTSCSELGSIMVTLVHPRTKEELQCMVREADVDGSGSSTSPSSSRSTRREFDDDGAMEDLRSAFLVYDVDRSGAISEEELHQVSRSLGERTSMAECGDMMKGVHSNGDGWAGQL